jgi:microcystin-dependent protein
MSRARDNADLGDSYGSLGAGVTGGSGLTLGGTVGQISAFGVATAPTGWIICNGASLARTGTYATLFAVIGTAWGTVDGNTFTLPDLRSAFLRGAGTSTAFTQDSTTTFAAAVNDQLQGHQHRFHSVSDNAGTDWNNNRGGGANASSDVNGVYEPETYSASGTVRYGTETRPNNIGVNYCIKF